MNYLGFTKQERIVILFIVCSILIGGALKLYREKTDDSIKKHFILFKDRKEQIQKFKERSKVVLNADHSSQTDTATHSIAEPYKMRSNKRKYADLLLGKPKININAAPIEELIQLPDIGPVRANQIIEYRKKVGKFKHIKEIMAVKGIGRKTFQKIAPFITVE